MPHPTREMHAVNFRTYVTEFPVIYDFSKLIKNIFSQKSKFLKTLFITSGNHFIGEPTGEYCTWHGNKPRYYIEYPSL
jgi:hypothetical protein